ncbi:hypothetical protein PG993_005445 [Apiospora rasikravindrae]|uniref:SET domain-containing protein n=1 Tax=Apiospora rasikravindrae TaxID=990691 RepID=A0ABR1TFL4_9PEZI
MAAIGTPAAGSPPENWPEEVQYLTDLVYSPAVTPDMRNALGRPSTTAESLDKITGALVAAPNNGDRVCIRTIASPAHHPALGQRGLFAAADMAPSAFLCLYVGRVHTDAREDTDVRSHYDLSFCQLDKEDLGGGGGGGLSIDATHCGNESRMANDFHGIADKANAEFRDCLVQVRSDRRREGWKWERRVGIFVCPAGLAGVGRRKGGAQSADGGGAGLKAGEEILVNYGREYWDSRNLTVHKTKARGS